MFQSTLPVAGERCASICSYVDLLMYLFQSTLPVAGERCRLSLSRLPSLTLFQSTLPVAGERCQPPGKSATDRHERFNPRSPLPGSDAPKQQHPNWPPRTGFNPRSPLPGSDAARKSSSDAANEFQSTLPVAGERCNTGGVWRADQANASLFQSTLPVAGERCPLLNSRTWSSSVSIHAPRCRGAMRCPLPTLALHSAVSIHAPRCRGAMRMA